MPSFYANLRSALSAPIGNRQTSTPDDLVRTRRNFSRQILYANCNAL